MRAREMRSRFESLILRVRHSSIFELKHQSNTTRFESLRVRDSNRGDNEEDTDTEGDDDHEIWAREVAKRYWCGVKRRMAIRVIEERTVSKGWD